MSNHEQQSDEPIVHEFSDGSAVAYMPNASAPPPPAPATPQHSQNEAQNARKLTERDAAWLAANPQESAPATPAQPETRTASPIPGLPGPAHWHEPPMCTCEEESDAQTPAQPAKARKARKARMSDKIRPAPRAADTADKLAEDLAVAQSQIENNDVTLEQIRITWRSKADKLAEALREVSDWALQNYETALRRIADKALAAYEQSKGGAQ